MRAASTRWSSRPRPTSRTSTRSTRSCRVALACPVGGLEFDARTLKLLDADGDGASALPTSSAPSHGCRRSSWTSATSSSPPTRIALGINLEQTTPGKSVRAGARLILENLGKGSSKTISLADVSDTEKIFVSTKLNGDGIVLPESAEDAGSAGHQRRSNRHRERCRSQRQARRRPGESRRLLRPGPRVRRVARDGTGELRPLARRWDWRRRGRARERAREDRRLFFRCRLAAFDARAVVALNASELGLAALSRWCSPRSPTVSPGCRSRGIEAGRALPLGDGLNPAWASRVADFARATGGAAARRPARHPDLPGLGYGHDEARGLRSLAGGEARHRGRKARGAARPRAGARRRPCKHHGAHRKGRGPRRGSDQIESVEKLVRFRRTLSRCSRTS